MTTVERIEERMSSPGGKLAMQLVGVAFATLLTALVTMTFLTHSEAGENATQALSQSRSNSRTLALMAQQTKMMAASQERMAATQSTNVQLIQSITMKLQHVTDTQEHIAKTQERIMQRSRP